VVQTAWCPHLGADLSGGQIVEGRLRCPYHHWSFDGSGACAHIASGDKIPPAARIFTYPTAEAWGIVWAFNGETPDYPVPGIPDADETSIAFTAAGTFSTLVSCAFALEPTASMTIPMTADARRPPSSLTTDVFALSGG